LDAALTVREGSVYFVVGWRRSSRGQGRCLPFWGWMSNMARNCSTCQHVNRAEIDRRLAAGEPGNQIAHDYDLNPSSLHRHRSNCLGLSSSSAIMKEVSRGTAAIVCLPGKDDLSTAYFQLRTQIDQIVQDARQQGS